MDLRRPVRVSHEYTQRLVAPPVSVFPLLCPVREREWVSGWKPGLVVSDSGVAERDCVFTTVSSGGGGRGHQGVGVATWYILEHDPEDFVVEMLKLAPDFVATRLRIELEEAEGMERVVVPGHGNREVLGLARVRYRHTALSDEGEAEVRSWDDSRWVEFMEGWQNELNIFLVRQQSRA